MQISVKKKFFYKFYKSEEKKSVNVMRMQLFHIVNQIQDLQSCLEFENLPRATSISSFFIAVCLLVDLGVPDPAVC